MAEQIKDIPAEPAVAPIEIKGDGYDEGLDLMNLPEAPWTVEKLGAELYGKIARVSGAFNPDLDQSFRPALDPRAFAAGRAANRARIFGIPKPGPEVNTPEKFEAWFAGLSPENQHAVNDLNAEAEALDALIAAKLPTPAGIGRKAGAKPLTPAKLKFTKRMF